MIVSVITCQFHRIVCVCVRVRGRCESVVACHSHMPRVGVDGRRRRRTVVCASKIDMRAAVATRTHAQHRGRSFFTTLLSFCFRPIAWPVAPRTAHTATPQRQKSGVLQCHTLLNNTTTLRA